MSLVVKDIGGLCGEVCWPITLHLVITTPFSIHHLIMIKQYVYQGAEAAIVLHVYYKKCM